MRDMNFPWYKPLSHYDTDGPWWVESCKFSIDGVSLLIEDAKLQGVHTMRGRFRCVCLDCDEELHHATTGASSRFRHHLKTKHAIIDEIGYMENESND